MGLLKSENKASPNVSRFDVFISYSRDDEVFVRRLYDTLNEKERRAWVDWKGILLVTFETEHVGEGDGCDAIHDFAVSQ